ncbi:hypothetical protein SynWH8101_0228 [Synechococcus sp. WH 8101]|nr:hypothetical protein SynWH8101_0228 [Synechococcus sp. WH 8101]
MTMILMPLDGMSDNRRGARKIISKLCWTHKGNFRTALVCHILNLCIIGGNNDLIKATTRLSCLD